MSKKVASGIGALKRIRPNVMFLFPICNLQLLIQRYFDDCSVAWDSCGSNLADKSRKLQNRAVSVLTSASYYTSADCLFERLGCKKLAS